VTLLLGKVTMYVVLWRFRPLVGRESEFERAYGPSGEWTRLFRRGDGYLGTELLRRSDDPREYLALDRWASRAAYEAFRARWSSEYRRLDRRLEELTEEETPLGAFEALP
jgi:heme-degrading monooxygenase HmoA